MNKHIKFSKSTIVGKAIIKQTNWIQGTMIKNQDVLSCEKAHADFTPA